MSKIKLYFKLLNLANRISYWIVNILLVLAIVGSLLLAGYYGSNYVRYVKVVNK